VFRLWAVALGVAALLDLVGCSFYVGRAEDAYTDGRYLEVAESLAQNEDNVVSLPKGQQARYGVYRGMALLQLGDYEGAQVWLNYAKAIEQTQPTLAPLHKRMLDSGWAELARVGFTAPGSSAPGSSAPGSSAPASSVFGPTQATP